MQEGKKKEKGRWRSLLPKMQVKRIEARKTKRDGGRIRINRGERSLAGSRRGLEPQHRGRKLKKGNTRGGRGGYVALWKKSHH